MEAVATVSSTPSVTPLPWKAVRSLARMGDVVDEVIGRLVDRIVGRIGFIVVLGGRIVRVVLVSLCRVVEIVGVEVDPQ